MDYNCGAQIFGNPGLLHIGPKVHAEESAESEDKKERPKSSRDLAEDAHVLGKPTLKEGSCHSPIKCTPPTLWPH